MTILAIELEGEQSSVAQAQGQRLAPRGFLPAMLDATAETVAQTMATLHERTAIGSELVGGEAVGSVELLCQVVGDVGVERTGRT